MNHLMRYEFVATLSLNTPLAVLQRHGEIHPGPTDALPQISTSTDGNWVHTTKSWAELAGPKADPAAVRRLKEPIIVPVDRVRPRLKEMGMSVRQLANFREDMVLNAIGTEVGPFPKDGGDYLAFLKAFRAIVESPSCQRPSG